MEFDASELDQKVKAQCFKQLSEAIEKCENCEAADINEISKACRKHKEMYSTYH